MAVEPLKKKKKKKKKSTFCSKVTNYRGIRVSERETAINLVQPITQQKFTLI
jgi:hypothetical protein